jgi:hypothetical protein
MARRAVDPPAVVYRNDPDIARATALATRAAIKAAVAETVAVSTYNRIVWTKVTSPLCSVSKCWTARTVEVSAV